MNNKTSLIITVLLLVAAYLIGSAYAKSKFGDVLGGRNDGPLPTLITSPTAVPFNPQKSGKPEVKFFVMSFCPYGNQAEAGLEPVYNLLKDKVSWTPRYIVTKVTDTMVTNCQQNCPQLVYNDNAKQQCDQAIKSGQIKDLATCKTYFPYTTAEECIQKECSTLKPGTFMSLHGNQELNQDVREILAFNLGDLGKWWKFISLINVNCNANNADTCWKAQATTAGIDTQNISSQEKSKATSLLDAEIVETEKYQVQGSPTVIINGAIYNGDRSPEAYKQAICLAFDNPPAECSTIIGSAGSGQLATASGGCTQ